MMPNFTKKIIILSIFLLGYIGVSQEYTPFSLRYQDNIKGDLTVISNQIVNRLDNVNGVTPLDPYNNLNTNGSFWPASNRNTETGGRYNYNDYKDMRYINVDPANTFNSSSATLTFPSASCNQIRYVGLYWSATYPRDNTTDPVGTARTLPINQVRLQIPGQTTYQTIAADNILFDGLSTPALAANAPYAAYADITNIVRGAQNPDGSYPDPTGVYTVADIAVAQGVGYDLATGTSHMTGGASGGWTMVVVYENPTLTGKLITTFDGFARVTGTSSIDINYNGFTTIPAGPVNANIGAGTLEGDFRIAGDFMSISAASNAGFTAMSNASNPANNFFNSNITLNGAQLPGRTPSSINTLGWDTDLFNLNNFANSVIPNAETAATFRFGTNGDQYYPFFNSFNIEIIEPDIILEKKVEDIAGNDITGLGVNLGQTLDYVLSFENIGNDDATNYTIRDILPINVTLIESDFVLPAGVTYTYDLATRTVVFTIPDNLVEVGDPETDIRMRVRVAENCFDFIDACTDLIQNLAYSTYQGVVNNNQITDDPSVTLFNNCTPPIPGATNFLLDDLENCNFTRTVQLCGDNVLLDAGDNFDSYVWVSDDNNNGIQDPSDTVLNDGDPDGDPSTLLVTQEGTYIVDKIVADPCKGFKEIMVVERFGTNAEDPIIDYFNTLNSDADVTNDIEGEIVVCSIDGDELAKIFLCGAGDSQLLQTNITDAQTISWELLDEGSCTAAPDDCANKDGSCTWNQVATGSSYTANTAGKYRLVVTYQNGCFNRFYFDVFQNILDIQYTSRDIICTTNGRINITNLGSNYGFQLIDITNNNIVVPFSANNGPDFTITTNGQYRVDAVQLDGSGNPINGACIFSTPDIGIRDRDFQVDVVTTPSNCNAQGTIKIDILNVEPNYTYILRQSDGTLIDDETAQVSNTHTFNVNAGNYAIEVSSDDGCTFTENVIVAETPDPTLSALLTRNIGCSAGMITMTAADGFPNPDYGFAIWSKDGTDLYATIADIPGSAYQVEDVFTFGWRDTDFDTIDEYFAGEDGTYVFVVVDANGCFAFSNPVTITDNGAMTIAITDTPVSCNGNNDAAISIVPTGGVGPYTYSIDGGATTQTSGSFVGLASGDYGVVVTDSSGCTIDMDHAIDNPDAILAEAVVTQDYMCSQDGEITVGSITPTSGGSGSYQYNINGGPWTTATSGGTVFSNLENGTFTVNIRDANSTTCVTSLPDIIIDPLPTPPTPSTSVTYNCDGSGIITVLSTDPDYFYFLDGGAAQTSPIFNNVPAGNHTITIDYGLDCQIETPVIVSSGNIFAANLVNTTNVSCNGLTDGTITFEVENFDATAGFEYSVDGGTTYIASTTSPVTTTAIYGSGSQTILVRKADETSCAASVNTTISEPTALVASASITTAISCTNGGATITAGVTGGTPTYVYQLEDTAGTPIGTYDFTTNGNNTVFTGIAPGDYIVRVRDTNLCEDPIDVALTIAPTNAITFDLTATKCYSGANDATIEVDVTTGNGDYTFSINGGPWVIPSPTNATSYTFTNLANGSYTINVSDGSGCIGVAQIIEIDPPITVSATAPNITACATSTFITITATGGDGSFQYAIMPDGVAPSMPDYDSSTYREVFAPGDYDIYLRDPSGGPDRCSAFTEITIVQDAPILITATPTPVVCFGDSNGAISLVVDSGGEAPYTYSIDNGANYVVGTNFPNLTAGTYPVIVRDANNCETTVQNVIVNGPDQLVAEATLTQEYTCNQLGQISVGSVTPTAGGSGDYQYSMNGGAWTASTTGGHTFIDLTDGTYSIRVRDANSISCETTLTDVIISPLPVTPVLTAAISYNCDGSGDITVTPFDADYIYILDGILPGQTGAGGNVITDVAVGNHTITVNYGSDCTVDIPVIIENGNAFEASITAFENLDCNADSSGTITISADNFGAGGYEYSLDATTFVGPFTVDEQITGLNAQAYTITVRDVDDPIAGCTIALNQALTEPTLIVAVASVTEEFTCNNTGATITASASGGTPTYEYQLEDNLGAVITAYQTSTAFTNLAAGNYIVRARDFNSCSDPIDTAITILAPVNPTFTATPTACYSGANDGSIVVDVTSVPGNGGFQFSLNSGPWITPTPVTATSHTFTNLGNATYTIDVRDAFGCSGAQQSITLDPQLTAIVETVDISNCADGSISVTASGGDGNFAYAFVTSGTIVTGGDFSASNTFAVTTGNDGNYDVYVWDNNAVDPHCEFMETVTVAPATPIVYTAVATDPDCHDGVGSIEVTISSGDNPYTIQIIDLDNAGASNQTNTNVVATTQSFFNLSPGDYTINVTDANNCVVTQTPITINNPDELTATIAPILPAACGSVDPNDYGFRFNGYPTTYPAGTTIEFSADGGTTWITSDTHMGYISGTSVFPSLRTVIGGVEVCRTDLPRYIIPFPLDDLDISISTVVVACNELQVTVQGTAGVPNYEYAYTDDPSTFDIATAAWTAPTPGAHTWTGLIPGRTYVFYVRDSTGCIRQSNVNVNDITTNPLEITAAFEPSCSGANDAEITYTINDTDGTSHPSMRWEFYDANTNALVQTNAGHPAAIPTASTITINGLAPGEYYIVVTEVDGGGTDACVSGSENLLIEELNPITATLNKLADISCNAPGLISVDNIQGGGGTFNFTVTGPVGFTTITGTSDNPISIPANSPAGGYFVRVTDQFDCFADFGPINLTLTPNPTIDSMVVDNCAAPSSLTINATSTAAQILYSIDGGATYVDNGGVFNNLAVNTYNVAIIDSNGCTDTDTIEIFPVLEANVSLTKLIDCTASPDAQITIDVTFGSGDYDYQITNSLGVVQTRTTLLTDPLIYSTSIPEDYVITLFDNNTSAPECNRVFNINVPTVLTPAFTETHVDVTCNGSTDGTITLTETPNGINPLTYTITPAAGTFNAATNTFENLPVNTYTVTGRGTNNCTFDIAGIIIGEPTAIAVPAPTIVEFGCTTGNNQNNATITVDATGITGGSNTFVRYEFINDQGTPATGDDVVEQDGSNTVYIETNIAGGTYIINVYDDKGCVGTTSATILPYVSITDPTVTITQDITCNPGNDAEITVGVTVTPTAGATDLSFAVSGTDNAYNAPNQPSNAFTALGIGNYLVTVTNHLTGCVVQTTFEIEDPNTFEIATTTTDVVCFGDNGSVSFTISDLINPYAGGFAWQVYESQGTVALGDDVLVAGASGVSANAGPTTPFAIGAGEYRVEITQDSDPSCINNAMFTIAGPSAAVTANTEVTPITCVGNDGIIEIIDVLGGWGGYQYYVGTVAPTVVGDYVTVPKFENLAPGTYQAWVIDQDGCPAEIQSNIVLADPTPINAQLQLNQPNCPNFSGEIEVINVTGGQGSNYVYQLIKDGTPVGATQNTTTFSGLDAGSYTVQITDQWTCTFTTAAQLLYAPIVPLATVVKTIDCTVDPGGQITVTQTGGSGNFTYAVEFPDGSTPQPTNTTGIFTTLTQVGDYIFTITDQAVGHACPVNITQNLQDQVLPVLSIDAFTNVTCNGGDNGTITVSALDNGVGPYVFEIIAGDGSSIGAPILPTSNTTNSASFENLAGAITPGITYTIRATAANECTTDITQVITQPEAITNVSATVVEFGCVAGNNGDFATITIDDTALTGGSGNYVRYEFINTSTSTTVQDGANASYTETNFDGGSYTINVYDSNGCFGSTTANIIPFVSISNATVTTLANVTCTPGNDGQIQVGVIINPSTATPNLEYTTTGVNVVYSQTNATGVFGGLGIGNYAITITNLDTNCVVETTYEVLNPDIIDVVATKLTDEECLNNGVDEGSFSVAITDYTGNYSYQVYDDSNNPVAGFSGTGNTSTPLIISNLPGGIYYVRISETDAPFCEEDSNSITIIAPEFPISLTVSEEASPSCTNDQGSILIDPEGGVGPYTITLTNTTTSQTYTETNVSAFIFSGLSGGNFDITVTDAMSCPITDTIILLTPDALLATITSTPLVCYNGNTGTVTAAVNSRNVTPNYLYRLNRYDATGTSIVTTSANQTSSTFVGLNAGFYSITASDDVGCSADTSIIEIVNPTQVEAQLIRTSPLTCTTGVELLLSATGGSGVYEYSTDNATWIAMTGSSQNLPVTGTLGAGTYRYFVRDATNTCAAVQSNEISEDAIEALVLTVDTSAAFINCNAEATAAIYASATGGLGNYMYELYTDVSLSVPSRIAGPQSLGEFTNLAAGTYFVNVFSEDCTTPAQQVIITEPTPLDYTEDVVNVVCFGDENGSIAVTLSGGSGGYQYAISPNLNQFDEENVFDKLAPGDYTIIAQDQNGCFIELQYTITAPELLSMSATATPEICVGDADGTINLTITGGVAPYSTRLSTESVFVQDRVSITGLPADGYIIFVRDANGCEADTGITVEAGANLNATVEPVYECSGDTPDNYVNITLEDSTVLGDVLYALDSTDPADMQLNPDFRNITPGMHYIAIAHANGCVRTIDFEIETFEPLTLTLEQLALNEITATAGGGKESYTFIFGDENNGSDNTFRINRTDTYVVTVIDDNGCEVQASIFIEFVDIDIPNFFTPDGDGQNDIWKPRNQEAFPEILTIIFDRYGREVYRLTLNTPGWDGLYQQSELPTGDYWYVIKLRGESDDREFVGNFTLYR